MSILEYKGYKAEIDYNIEDKVIVGKVLFIESSISFHAENASDIEHEFHVAVDSYLTYCKKHKVEPNKSYSGTFNIRTGSELHKAAAQAAYMKGQTLNEFCASALEVAVASSQGLTVPLVRRLIDNVQLGGAIVSNPYPSTSPVMQGSNISQGMIGSNPYGVINPELFDVH